MNNPKMFWSFHSLKSKTRQIPPAVTYKLKSASDPAEKASLLSMSTSTLEVQKILGKLDVNKGTGADNIPVRILKRMF